MKAQLLCAAFTVIIYFSVYYVQCSRIIAPYPGTQTEVIQRKGPIYAFILPGKISPNNDYIITAMFDGHDGETNVEFTITTYRNNKNAIQYSLNEKFTGNETKVLKIKIGDLIPHHKTHINITGDGKLKFNHNGIRLIPESHGDVVLLQTDKAMYKPEQAVKIRVVVVDSKLLPINGRQVLILIRDGKANIVKRHKGVTKYGMVALEFKLSDEPVLGKWRITVNHQVGKQWVYGTNKVIEVAEYILPSFDLNLNVPKVLTFQTKEIPVTVVAKYTYSKQVKGDLTLYVQDHNYGEYVSGKFIYRTNYEVRAKFSGQITIEVPESTLNINRNSYQQSYHLIAIVKDELTGRVYNKTSDIVVYRHPYVFQLINPTRYFTADLPYSATFKITTRDGLPVPNNGPSVTVKYGFGWDERIMDREVTAVPVNGFFVVDIDTKFTKSEATIFTQKVVKSKKCYIYYRKVYPPKVERHSINIFLKYKNITESVGGIYKQLKQAKGCWMQVKQHNFALEVPKVNDVINVTINFGTHLKYFIYEIVSKKGVIESKIINVTGLQHNITIKLQDSMTPQFRFIAYTLCNGSMISSQFDAPIESPYTDIKITTNMNETKPGFPITINVQTKSKSAIALLAVDKKTTLLKTGNDISKTDVDIEMQKQIGCHRAPYYASCVDFANSGKFGYHPYTLEQSGLTFISNMRYHHIRHHYNYAANEGFARARIMHKHVGRGAAAIGGRAPRRMVSSDKVNYSLRSFGVAQSNEIRLRKHFPETWIWDIKESDNNGNITFTSKVPDSITSWYISAFSLGEKSTLGFSVNKPSVTVFQPFFIKASLPYSVIRGETLSLQVTVYNYLKEKVTAKVTLFNEKNHFLFVGSSAQNSQIISADIGSEDAKTIVFKVIPTKVGYINFKVSAITGQAGDVLLENLLVKPEGETIHVNKATLIKFDNKTQLIKNEFNIEIPKQAVADSERIVFKAIGDILGPAINHLEDLVRMPYGCGEQNMINLVPNILVLDYLTKSGRLTEKIKQKAIEHIEVGYQRELIYAHHDHSFSAFGKHDLFGSTWLTAFVMKTFRQMHSYVPIDWHRQHLTAKFLRSVQANDGSFKEHGNVIHKEMQSKSGLNSVSLTAYVTIAITVKERYFGSFVNLLKDKNFMENAIKATSDVYEIAIVTYALHLLNSKEKDFAFNKLADLRKEEGEFIYWKSKEDNYASIEITSYALMTYLERRMINKALPVVKWLVSKQNSRGGFTSTQDTVISLEALAKFAETVNAAKNDVKIEVSAIGLDTQVLNINKENSLVLQEIIIPKKSPVVKITASGKGVCLVQLSYKYNIVKKAIKDYFDITYKLSPNNDLSGFQLDVCTKYLKEKSSGMAVMQIYFPSGFIIDSDSVNELRNKISHNGIKRVDVSNANTLLTVYFDKITHIFRCVSIAAIREIEVFNLKGAPIAVYDYYDKRKSTTIFYDLTPKHETKPTVPVTQHVITLPTRPTIATTNTITETTTEATTGSKVIVRDD